jgi:recombinational DNA repair protein (RecF pathway)
MSDAEVLRGKTRCATCGGKVLEGAARAILYVSPARYSIACINCARSEAGLNRELVKVPSLALDPNRRAS